MLILGSGMSYHNMRDFGTTTAHRPSLVFDAWLQQAATADPETRARRLGDWASAPGARQAHPREEHLLPLMVVAGAAGDDRAHHVQRRPDERARLGGPVRLTALAVRPARGLAPSPRELARGAALLTADVAALSR